MPLDLTTPRPLSEAVKAVSAKTPVGSKLRTKGWETRVQKGLREQAFWSAGVESVRALEEVQEGIGKILGEVKNARTGGYAMDRAKLVQQAQQTANKLGLRNADPQKRGGLEDYGSERRIKLILEQQISSAQSKAYHDQGNDPDLLAAFPALRLVRVRSTRVQRDWGKRWAQAAEAVGWVGVARNGEWVALKNSPIWRALSRFGRPYPPFDFNSGMGVEEVAAEDAQAMGLDVASVGDGGVSAWEEEQEASVRGLKPGAVAQLKKLFGEQVEIVDGVARWKGGKRG